MESEQLNCLLADEAFGKFLERHDINVLIEATNHRIEKSNSPWEFTYNSTNRWVSYITYAVSGAITRFVAAAITAVVIVLVLLGGLWLAYTYLAQHVFYIILAVAAVDMALGIVLRAILSRR